jgi:hypothetical protein
MGLLRKALPTVIVLAALLALGPTSVWAQSGTASVSGHVTDQQGGAVPGAVVTLIREATAATRFTVTSPSGIYQFVGAPPGLYALTVELAGFAISRVENVELRVDASLRQDVELSLGDLTETLTVAAESPLINTTDATMGNTIDERAITNLPVEARSVVELLSLQPGSVYVPFNEVQNDADEADPRFGSVSGARADQQTVTLDGVDVNDPELQYAYTSAVRITQEALQEFRVSTSNYGAQYGRSSGPQVSLVTKSGTNRFRGSAYFYRRDTDFSANEYFNKLATQPEGVNEAPLLDKNTFGGSLGGPIVKDRVFFFVNYEQLGEESERPVVRGVPSGSFRDGVLQYECEDPAACPGGSVAGFNGTHTVQPGWYGLTPAEIAAIDPLGIGPSMPGSQYFNQFPMPNEPGLDGVNIMDYRFPSPIKNDFKTYIARLDASLNESGTQNLFVRFNAQDDVVNDPAQYPDGPPRSADTFKNWGIAVGHDWVISNNLMNTFRYGYTKIDANTVGLVNDNIVSFRFIDDFIPFTYTSARTTPTHNFVEELSWLTGRHTLKVGANVRFTRIPSVRDSSSWNFTEINPSWVDGVGRKYMPGRPGCTTPGCSQVPAVASTFQSGYADAWLNILGVLSEANLNANYLTDGTLLGVGEPVPREYATDEYDFYIQDRWQLSPSFTLTAGLRYSLYSPPWEVNGQQVAPTPSMGEWFAQREANMMAGIPSTASPTVSFDLAGPANGKKGFYDWDRNNFGPSIAFAWTPRADDGILGSLTGNNRLVIRGGYSKVFDRVGLGLARFFDRNLAFGMSTNLSSPFGAPYEENPEVRFVDINTMPPTMPAPPPGGFPATPPLRAGQITGSIDDTLVTPSAHMLNLAVSRQFGNDWSVEAAYVGRFGRDQLVRRDLAMPLDLADPASGMTYFEAAQQMIQAYQSAGLDFNSPPSAYRGLAPIAYWENLFPDMAGYPEAGLSATQSMAYFYNEFDPDYITALWLLDQFCDPTCSIFGDYAYFSEQYDSLASVSSIGRSSYNALQLTLRKRYSQGFQFDLNYTMGTSRDLASGAEREDVFTNYGTGGYTGFLINTWDPDASWGKSDYNVRHQVNFNWIWDLPFGSGQRWGENASGFKNQLIGDWSFSGLVRWTSGFPFTVINCRSCWATNWNLQGNAELVTPGVLPALATTTDAVDNRPSPFVDPEGARDFFRFALPGEQGLRNDMEGDGYFTIDLSFAKVFKLGGRHRLRFRWDIFNLTNTPSYDVYFLNALPDRSGFGRYDGTYATCDALAGRCMQFALRYEF